MHSYPFQQHLAVFQALTKALTERGIRHYLIGGQARDLLLSQKEIRPISVTTDIDFAILIHDDGQFEALKAALFDDGFEPTEFSYRIRWKSTMTWIDLLPFGSIAREGKVHFARQFTELSVSGFAELIDTLEHCYLDVAQTLSIPVAPLHGIFMLKILSWDDRPEVRQKDLDDLHQILIHYWDFYIDEAFDHHQDIFDDQPNYMESYGARILGRHMARTLTNSQALKARISGILKRQLALVNPPGPMLWRFARETEDAGKTIAFSQELLQQILQGLEEEY